MSLSVYNRKGYFYFHAQPNRRFKKLNSFFLFVNNSAHHGAVSFINHCIQGHSQTYVSDGEREICNQNFKHFYEASGLKNLWESKKKTLKFTLKIFWRGWPFLHRLTIFKTHVTFLNEKFHFLSKTMPCINKKSSLFSSKRMCLHKWRSV